MVSGLGEDKVFLESGFGWKAEREITLTPLGRRRRRGWGESVGEGVEWEEEKGGERDLLSLCNHYWMKEQPLFATCMILPPNPLYSHVRLPEQQQGVWGVEKRGLGFDTTAIRHANSLIRFHCWHSLLSKIKPGFTRVTKVPSCKKNTLKLSNQDQLPGERDFLPLYFVKRLTALASEKGRSNLFFENLYAIHRVFRKWLCKCFFT